jgi:transposase, IS5 family
MISFSLSAESLTEIIAGLNWLSLIPWSDFEDAYAQNFKSPTRGEEALSVRVALGTLIIQTKLKLVDAEVPLQIMENPYLQYFLGFDSFEDDRQPFDASLITHFRKRFTPDILLEINNIIAMKELEAAAASESAMTMMITKITAPAD